MKSHVLHIGIQKRKALYVVSGLAGAVNRIVKCVFSVLSFKKDWLFGILIAKAKVSCPVSFQVWKTSMADRKKKILQIANVNS